MKNNIEKSFLDSAECIKKSVNLSEMVEKAIKEIINCLERGNKIIIFGNGGSAADAQHIAAEFISKFKRPKKFPSNSTNYRYFNSYINWKRLFI